MDVRGREPGKGGRELKRKERGRESEEGKGREEGISYSAAIKKMFSSSVILVFKNMFDALN